MNQTLAAQSVMLTVRLSLAVKRGEKNKAVLDKCIDNVGNLYLKQKEGRKE